MQKEKKIKFKAAFLIISALVFGISLPAAARAAEQSEPTEEVIEGDFSEFIDSDGYYTDTPSSEIQEFITRTSKATETSFEDYLVECLTARQESIDFSSYSISTNDISSAVIAVIYKHPELYFVNIYDYYTYSRLESDYSYVGYYYPSYCTWDDVDVEAVIEEETENFLSVIDDDMTDLEKLVTIHDYICMNMHYAYQEYLDDTLTFDVHTLKGALVDKTIVCDGYANTFTYFASLVDIPCNLMVGYAGEYHAWNQVELDGEWYLVDATWDDGSWDMYGYVNHDYFLKSSGSSYFDGRTWETDDYEECSSDYYDDAFWNGVTSQLVEYGGEWYYIDGNDIYEADQGIYKHSLDPADIETDGTMITHIDGYWWVLEDEYAGSTWGSYAVLESLGGILYYSTPEAIYSCNFDGSDNTLVCEAENAGSTNGYIYGMKLDGSSLLYQMATTPYVSAQSDLVVYSAETDNVGAASFALDVDSFAYTGEDQYAEITIALDGETLEEGTDYTVTYDFPANGTGTVTVTITGAGKYVGEQIITYEITKGDQTIDVAKNFAVTEGDSAFSLEAFAQGALTYSSANEAVVTVSDDGTVTIVGAGSTVITICAAETDCYYAAETTVNITVKARATASSAASVLTNSTDSSSSTTDSAADTSASVLAASTASDSADTSAPSKVKKVKVKTAGKKKVTVKWKKLSCDGYRIYISKSSNFTKGVKKVTVKGGSKTSKTISGLVSGKKYYIRVQAYKKVNGKKVYGSLSKKVAIRVK